MDVALLLLLPLVGGYYFATNSHFCRYRSAREEGHRLYFRAAFYGTFLFLGALVFRNLLLELEAYRSLERLVSYWVLQIVKDPDKSHQFPLAAISFYSMALSMPIVWLTNIVLSEQKCLEKALKNNDFERVVQRGWVNSLPICLSMENCKVYVGFVVSTVDPSRDRKSIGILPVISGYRNDEGRIVFTTNYRSVYDKLKHKSQDELAPRDFEIALPVEKIQSCNVFNFHAYGIFAADSTEQPKPIIPWKKRLKSKSWAR